MQLTKVAAPSLEAVEVRGLSACRQCRRVKCRSRRLLQMQRSLGGLCLCMLLILRLNGRVGVRRLMTEAELKVLQICLYILQHTAPAC